MFRYAYVWLRLLLLLFGLFFFFFVADYCCCSCTLRSSCSMAMRICMYILFKQLWTVVWSLDSLLFVEKKKQKINCKTSRAHTNYCSAHERQNVLRRTTSSVEMKMTMTRTRRQTQRKHNTPCYPLSTHTCMCVYNACLSFCMSVCVCVRQYPYVCCCSCCCFSCSGAHKVRSVFTSLALRYSRLLSVWRKIDCVFRWVIWYEEIFFKHAIGL